MIKTIKVWSWRMEDDDGLHTFIWFASTYGSKEKPEEDQTMHATTHYD